MSIITTAQWVPRGFAAPFPKKYTLDEAEFDRIASLAQLQLDDAREDLKAAEIVDEGVKEDSPQADAHSRTSKDDDLKEYDLEHYDDDDDEKEANEKGQTMGMFGNVKSLAYYESNEDDPYITLQGDDDDDDDDRQDLQIMATDNLILSAKVEDELAQLEVYVFEDEGDNLYVHHDLMLPAIPLCLEWLDMPVGSRKGTVEAARGSYVAVGTMDPDIEIWDLDTIDSMYPDAILGQGDSTDKDKKKLKKKKKKSKRANDEYHVDAVLSLAANRSHRNLLASASADQTVKLWDVNTVKCAQSYSYHTDKVCSLAWSATEATVLLSGSYDRTVVAADMRAPGAKVPRWGVESDVENVRWDPHDGNMFFVSTDKGAVHYHDVRQAPRNVEATKSVWTLQAHDESVSSLDVNAVIPGFMATGSTDRTVKLWNVTATGPSMVVSRNLDVGKVFAATFAPDAAVAFRLAVAGSSGSMHVWDTSTNAAVRKVFAHRMMPGRSETAAEDRLVGVEEDEEDEDEDEDENDGGSSGQGSRGDSMDED
ncbi:hypothetical protein CDD80_6277 [Ophiocordyceps camponoti-rufipedis]|uniref:Uncharacterized protein n=1 Tax=Ophiocordyceps camponoti-rufipedis TaxID=2004952 RepID=A0A2C5XVX4_9HYPO|nr:hypothetical protein CDD80_6277 [Ophiocordyceps camponoti-rufipedis]